MEREMAESVTKESSASSARTPVFSNKKSLCISTGNVVELQRLRRRTNIQSHEELELSLSEVLNAWMKSPSAYRENEEHLNINKKAGVVDDDANENGYENDDVSVKKRDALKYVVKIFPSPRALPAEIRETIEMSLKEMGVDFVDALVVSFPNFGGGGDEGGGRDDEDVRVALPPRAEVEARGIDDAMTTWNVLEDLMTVGKALSLGVADLNKSQLEQLLKRAKRQPIVNQVNLTTCCVIADDLKSLAKEHDIQLLIHNDPRSMIDDSGLERLLLSAVANSWQVSEEDATGWRPSCLLRYSAMVKGRGVIKTKGYILQAKKP